MIGEERAGESGAMDAGSAGKERRSGADRRSGRRRQVEKAVPAERRLGFDRRTLRERRGMAARKGGAGLIAGWATTPETSVPFASRLRQLAQLDFPDAEAERQWRALARHRRNLADRVGRDVGDEVAMLDYFLNVNPRLTQPVIIEGAALAALERDALTDALTGLFNRRCLESVLTREVARRRRHGATSSVALLDLDGFKAANDRFGHGVGDAVLRALGELICRHLRAEDIPCRYGGDEFGVVLPDTDQSHARIVAQRIRADARTHFAEHAAGGRKVAVTVSVGVATFGPTCGTLHALLKAADGALYEAKAAGGDRVAVAR
jgi:diguanylate cyclase (GGDEF)-like protein